MNAVASTVTAEDRPEYGTLADLRRLFGIPRSTAYELEARGDIQFTRIRKRGNKRGKVLVKLDSVRAYLTACEATHSPASK